MTTVKLGISRNFQQWYTTSNATSYSSNEVSIVKTFNPDAKWLFKLKHLRINRL